MAVSSSQATANGSALTGFAAASAAAEQFASAPPSTAAMATQTYQEAAFAQYFSSMQTSSMAAAAGAGAGSAAAYAVSGGSGTMHRAVQVR